MLPGDLEPTEAVEPWAALLPPLDPTTMGWFERDLYLEPYKAELFDSTGNGGPTVWWDGRVVGGWRQSDAGEVVLQMLEDVGAEGRDAVERDSARLTEWFGGTRAPAIPLAAVEARRVLSLRPARGCASRSRSAAGARGGFGTAAFKDGFGAVTVRYAVAPVTPGGGTPTGNVTVSDGVDSCTGTVAAGSCDITLTTVGARSLKLIPTAGRKSEEMPVNVPLGAPVGWVRCRAHPLAVRRAANVQARSRIDR